MAKACFKCFGKKTNWAFAIAVSILLAVLLGLLIWYIVDMSRKERYTETSSAKLSNACKYNELTNPSSCALSTCPCYLKDGKNPTSCYGIPFVWKRKTTQPTTKRLRLQTAGTAPISKGICIFGVGERLIGTNQSSIVPYGDTFNSPKTEIHFGGGQKCNTLKIKYGLEGGELNKYIDLDTTDLENLQKGGYVVECDENLNSSVKDYRSLSVPVKNAGTSTTITIRGINTCNLCMNNTGGSCLDCGSKTVWSQLAPGENGYIYWPYDPKTSTCSNMYVNVTDQNGNTSGPIMVSPGEGQPTLSVNCDKNPCKYTYKIASKTCNTNEVCNTSAICSDPITNFNKSYVCGNPEGQCMRKIDMYGHCNTRVANWDGKVCVYRGAVAKDGSAPLYTDCNTETGCPTPKTGYELLYNEDLTTYCPVVPQTFCDTDTVCNTEAICSDPVANYKKSYICGNPEGQCMRKIDMENHCSAQDVNWDGKVCVYQGPLSANQSAGVYTTCHKATGCEPKDDWVLLGIPRLTEYCPPARDECNLDKLCPISNSACGYPVSNRCMPIADIKENCESIYGSGNVDGVCAYVESNGTMNLACHEKGKTCTGSELPTPTDWKPYPFTDGFLSWEDIPNYVSRTPINDPCSSTYDNPWKCTSISIFNKSKQAALFTFDNAKIPLGCSTNNTLTLIPNLGGALVWTPSFGCTATTIPIIVLDPTTKKQIGSFNADTNSAAKGVAYVFNGPNNISTLDLTKKSGVIPIYNDTAYSTTGQKSTVGPVYMSVQGAVGKQRTGTVRAACDSDLTYEACSSKMGTLNAPTQGDKGYIYWNYDDESCVCNKVNVVLSPSSSSPNGKVVPIDLYHNEGGPEECIQCSCPYVGGGPPIDAYECSCRLLTDTATNKPCAALKTKFAS